MLLAVLSEEHVNRLVEAVEAVEAVEDLKEHVNSLKKTASRFTNRLNKATKTSGKTSGKRAARLAQLVRNAGQQEVELLVKHGGQQSSASTAGYASEATSGNTTGTSALDFRMDNPLANMRDADAGAAVAVAVAGRPQSAYFGAAPIAPCMPPNMPPVAHASNPAVIGNVAVASPAPMYVNADRQISLREDESTEEYECDGGEDDEEFEEKKGGEAGASNAPSEGKSAAPVPVVMPVMVLQAPVVVQADSMESIKYETLY